MMFDQEEADTLLNMPKEFADLAPLEFTLREPMNYDRELRSTDRRELFFLTVERGTRNRMRLKYQTRARGIVVLARLELNGPRHRNPPDSPYKPGEWIGGSHLHVYREGFDTRIAYELGDAPGWFGDSNPDGVAALETFIDYCAVVEKPPIQTAM